MNNINFCLNPFNYISVEKNGNCYFCCSVFYKKDYIIGNIFKDDIDEIWNGERAQEFRKQFLKKDYEYCDIEKCRFCYERYDNAFTNKIDVITEYPKVVHLCYDNTCSQRCIFCRDEIKRFSKNDEKYYNEFIMTKILPLLQNASILSLNGFGEVFDSPHSKLVIKTVVEQYPDLKLELWSNGINFTKQNIKNLNILNRIEIVHISVNAGSKRIYKKIFRSDNFERVKKNILYLVSLKNINLIKEIHLNYIINSVNYKDMKNFMKFAKDLDVTISFSLAHASGTNFTKEDEIFAVYKPSHYLYNDFLKTLKHPIFLSKNCNFDFNTNLQPISRKQTLKNLINRIKIFLKYKF